MRRNPPQTPCLHTDVRGVMKGSSRRLADTADSRTCANIDRGSFTPRL